MDRFYTIVLSIAVCLLIIILTFIGIKMAYNRRSGNGKNQFPPIYSECPDYWTADSQGNCIVNSLNTPNSVITTSTPGYISQNQINFQDKGWSTMGKTRQCALKDWVNKYNVTWDGITNYNACN
jgi:hypothetical protein